LTSCEEIIPLCMATDQPIPVVDQQGTLVGEIRRESVAAAIAPGSHKAAPVPASEESDTRPTP
jgi:hypothetical protein